MDPQRNIRMVPPPYQPSAHTPLVPQAPADPLEQRVIDLLYPFRNECFTEEDRPVAEHERKALVLSENIAFLIRHNQSSYGKAIEPNDVSMASRNWPMTSDTQAAGIGVFVNGNGFTHTTVRVKVQPGENAIEVLSVEVGRLLQNFFPGV